MTFKCINIWFQKESKTLMDKLGLEDDESIDNKMVTKEVKMLKRRLKFNFDIEKNLMDMTM